MSKINGLEQLNKAGIGKPAHTGDNWLNQVNDTINNFKSMAKMVTELKGAQAGEPPRAGIAENRQLPQGQGWQGIIKALMAAGYGDVPIGQILQQLAPYSLKQLLELGKNVRPEK